MDKYIRQLLLLDSKVNLPQFGAIVLTNEETGVLMFNEYLTYDDGKIVELFVKEGNIEPEEAKHKVKNLVQEIQSKLENGGTYSLGDLGIFSKAEDKIIFNGNLKTGGSAPASVKTDLEEKSKVTKENIYIEKKENAPVSQDKVTNEKSIDDKPKKQEDNKSKSEGKLKKDRIIAEKKKTKKEKTEKKRKDKEERKRKKIEEKNKRIVEKERLKNEKNKKVKTPVKTENIMVQTKDQKKANNQDGKTNEQKRKPAFWILIILILALLIGGIWIGLNYKSVKTYMGWNKLEKSDLPKNNNQTTKDNNKSSIAKEPIKVADEGDYLDTNNANDTLPETVQSATSNNIEVDHTEPQFPQVKTSTTGKYRIIVGGFQEISNAENMVKSLNNQGFNSEMLTGIYTGLELHFVSAQGYSTLDDAKSDLQRIQQSVNKDAWIFKK